MTYQCPINPEGNHSFVIRARAHRLPRRFKPSNLSSKLVKGRKASTSRLSAVLDRRNFNLDSRFEALSTNLDANIPHGRETRDKAFLCLWQHYDTRNMFVLKILTPLAIQSPYTYF